MKLTNHHHHRLFPLFSLLLLVIICWHPVRGKSSNKHTNDTQQLQWKDINVLVLTDVHSWVGGHSSSSKEPHLNVNYGHVVSFYERLLQYCESLDKDLYFVVNGDWVDGTGISLNGNVFALTQILEKMPWDAVNVGNHELYHANLIDFITQPGSFVDWFGSRYLSSNIVRTASQQPLGNRYVVMQGKHTAVLTFGFLYNMKDHVSAVNVQEIEAVVQEPWFAEALHTESYDAILILAHMHVQDPLVQVILQTIREQVGVHMPVQFITGHTHIRDFAVLDEMSVSFEAGRYLDTIGFVSFPTQENAMVLLESINNQTTTNNTATKNTSSLLFTHNFLDANQETLRAVLNLKTPIDTPNGLELSRFIETIRDGMGLTQEMGCVNQSYVTDAAISNATSLWGLFIRQVVPNVLPGKHVLLFDKGDLRYDLLQGKVTLDDIIAVSPFNDTLYYWKDVPGSVVLQLNESLNANAETSWLPLLPSYILAPAETISLDDKYELITSEFDVPSMRDALILIYPEASQIEPQPMDLTSTMLWLNYFRAHSSCGIQHPKPTIHGHQHNDDPSYASSNASSTGDDGNGVDISEEDHIRLMFAGVAMGVILVLGSIHIWQRGRQFTKRLSAREAVILDARNEFSDTDDDPKTHMDEESDGLFI